MSSILQGGPEDRPPSLAWAMWKRFLAAAVLIITLGTVSTAAAILLEVDRNIDFFRDYAQPIGDVEGVLEDVDPGKPQTILVLGSDRRYADRVTGAPARSDTIILVRLDPAKNATAIMSIPRDLKVDIPGYQPDKINAAYSNGGPTLTVRTVQNLLSSTGYSFPIHHVVNVNFGGFQRAVNRLGCVYADIDRRYFNDNSPPFQSPVNYAAIDLKPGYQKLCGEDALSYVRFRHLDDDFVRGARQQEFLRQAKEQIGLGKVFGDREELLKIFGRYTQTDIAEDNTPAILRLLKLAYEASKNPTREIRFRGTQKDGEDYVEISDDALDKTVRQFLEVEESEGPRTSREGGEPRPRRIKASKDGLAPGLRQATKEGENHVLDMETRLRPGGLPVYFPGAILSRGGYISETGVPGDASLPRSYDLYDRTKKKYRAYRIVLSHGDNGQYYGVQGTTWKAAPILDNPTDSVEMRGRTYDRYFDGRKIRLIAWKTRSAVYWVSNTLSQKLTNKQMMGIARSLRRIGE